MTARAERLSMFDLYLSHVLQKATLCVKRYIVVGKKYISLRLISLYLLLTNQLKIHKSIYVQ